MSHIRLCNRTGPVPTGQNLHKGPSFGVVHGGETTLLGPGEPPDLRRIEVPHDRELRVTGHIEGSELLIANDPHVADVFVRFVSAGGRVENAVIRRGEWRTFTA